MNVAAIALDGLRRAPNTVRGEVVFTDGNNGSATGQAYGVAVRPSQADGFKEGAAITEKARKLTVLPDGLAFPPAASMTCTWAGDSYVVLTAKPFPEVGEPAFYTVTASR